MTFSSRPTLRPLVAGLVSLVACGACGSSSNGAVTDAGSQRDVAPLPPDHEELDAQAGGNADADATGKDAAPPPSTHLTNQTITVNGTSRTYDITLPGVCLPSHLVPLVFVFHGDGGKGSDMYGAAFPIEVAAASAGDEAMFVYPNGTNANQNGSAWNIYDDPGKFPYKQANPSGNDDVDFFDDMLTAFETHYCVDTTRVFITGFSNGGYMANQLARWRSRVIYATAPQSGGPPSGSTTPSNDYAPPNYCVGTTEPVPALIIHGTADTVVDPSNCEETASYWDMANACSGAASDCSATTNSLLVPPATTTTATTPSPCVTSSGCKAGHPVTLCQIPGMGHDIWSLAPQTIWAFFAAH
jgi:polyhydroxybutyrate depolymerase